jgi:transcriptional regulator with XRE-family HTH domain
VDRKHRDVTESADAVDLGTALRALRRRADLSQRELAQRSGVPQPTLARIESGRATDPRFRTVERLVRAAGGEITAGVRGEAEGAGGDDPTRDGRSLPAVPHDGMRDEAGRRYPAHLDVWEVREPKDWPGAWWAYWYNLPPERWPLKVPTATYELDRGYRDRRRRAEQVRREVGVRRVTGGGLPRTSWRFVAELPCGELVGELRAHERSPHLRYGGDERDWAREVVLDGVLVAAEHRRLGIGRRLVDALIGQLDEIGIGSACAIAEAEGIGFLAACGFQFEGVRPAALRLDRRLAG